MKFTSFFSAGLILLASSAAASTPIRVGLYSNQITLDPTGIQDQSSLLVSRQINCQLVRNKGRDVEKDAVEEILFLSPTRIAFKLKSALQFSDGTEVTANDVVRSFNYLKQYRRSQRNIFLWIKNIHAEDARTVVVDLRRPTPQFLNVLGTTSYSIFKKEFLATTAGNASAWNHAVGCGKYKISAFDQSDGIIRLDPVRAGRPIEFILSRDNQVASNDLDKLDMFPLTIVGNQSPPGFHEQQIFDPYQIFFGLNAAKSPWNNRKQRCSLLSRLDFTDVVNSYQSSAELAQDIFPRGVLGYSDAAMFKKHFSEVQSSDHSPLDRFCLSFLGVSVPAANRKAYESAFARLASSVKSNVINEVKDFGLVFRKKKCDGLIFGLKSNYLDAFEFVNIYTQENNDFSGLKNDPLIKRIQESQNIPDSAEKIKAYRSIAESLGLECVVYPILTIPYKKIWIRDGLVAPGIGEVPFNAYDLSQIR